MQPDVAAAIVAAFLDIFIGEARRQVGNQREESSEQKALYAADRAEQRRVAQAAKDYRQNLLDYHDRLRVFGKEHDDTLDDIFIDAFLLERRTAREIFGIRDLHEGDIILRGWSERERQRQNGMDIVARGKNLYILGKPGAGKTTFLKWATVRALKYIESAQPVDEANGEVEQQSDFFAAAGLRANRDVTQQSIRKQAWPSRS